MFLAEMDFLLMLRQRWSKIIEKNIDDATESLKYK